MKYCKLKYDLVADSLEEMSSIYQSLVKGDNNHVVEKEVLDLFFFFFW